jgi:alanine dehydrogenase
LRIGVPKETKVHEYRVGLTPASVREVVRHGHSVSVQEGAGAHIGLSDADYAQAGARILATAAEVFAGSELIVKVKEPQADEFPLLRAGQTLFTYLHLAAAPTLARALAESGVTAIAYETVTSPRGGLPLLAPMSEIAGRLAVQAGAHCLEMAQGGRGVLLSGASGVPRAKVTVLGGGVAGGNALRMAIGLEAHVTVIDVSVERLQQLDHFYGSRLNTMYSTQSAIEDCVLESDLVIGAVLAPGAAAAKLVTREMVEGMKRGAVIVDVSIDQGGCVETSRPTTHANPTFIDHDVVHYCVTNMPGAVARTATLSLNNVTLPFLLALLREGPENALKRDPHLRNGLNVHQGRITHRAVAETLKLDFTPPEQALEKV